VLRILGKYISNLNIYFLVIFKWNNKLAPVKFKSFENIQILKFLRKKTKIQKKDMENI